MRKYQVEFYRLKVGSIFCNNGNRYKKMSTRTAHLLEYDRRFYFGQNEYVTFTNIAYLEN